MIAQGSGRIVNLSSQAGFVALPGEAIYCASKAAVAHLTSCLAVEWGRHGINVNAVAPTFIRTPGTEPALVGPGLRGRCHRAHRGAPPRRRAGRRRGRGRLPLGPGLGARDRHDAHGRRRLDRPLRPADQRQPSPHAWASHLAALAWDHRWRDRASTPGVAPALRRAAPSGGELGRRGHRRRELEVIEPDHRRRTLGRGDVLDRADEHAVDHAEMAAGAPPTVRSARQFASCRCVSRPATRSQPGRHL